MSQGIKRSILRWIHLIFSIPIIGYAYSPFEVLPNYAPIVSIYRCSRNCRDGTVDVERPCPRATDFEKIAGRLGVNTVAGNTSRKSAEVANKAAARPVKLLSGGNPQIAKAYGDAPVQDYIAAMPGWKSDVGRRLDALIVRTVPNVYKAVKWNSPFYGIEGQGWFLGIHCFTTHIKVAFFCGTSLRPLPPGESKQKEARYLDIHKGDPIDEAQFADWVKQASRLPGVRM
jgi:hypothetical protein